jgi:Tol biopolymer transport system component
MPFLVHLCRAVSVTFILGLVFSITNPARAQVRANGKISFSSTGAGSGEIFVMNPDGSARTQLTNNSRLDEQPDWSPDGTKIAFASTRDGNEEIYVMNADGSNQTRITFVTSANDFFPDWSPDGTKIAFVSTRDGGDSEIYVMNADGSAQTRLTFTNNLLIDDFGPAWSPNGTKIAFYSNRDGDHEIFVMNADGSAQTQLTNNSAGDFTPSWSPDGSKIVFTSNRDGNNEIYMMNADGSGQTRITNNPASDGLPDWSPDGQRIAFASNRDGGNQEIYVMNIDGSGQTNITNNPGFDNEPSWQPAALVGIISEFRFHGAAGATDEFIELANTNNTAFTVNSADGSAGWTLVAAGGTVLAQIPNGTTVPPHGHLLVVNSAGYSLSGYPAGNGAGATGDFSYTQDIPDNSGVALFATQNAANFSASLRLDAVGFTLVADPLYREGAGIAGFPSSDGEYSLVRKLTTGQPRDANDNNSDFVFVATQGDTIYGLDSNFSVLGAPGPENLSSPVEHNADVKAALLDSCSGPGPCQNRVRSPAPDPTQSACSPLGTLSIRRRFKNTTQQPLTRLRFRVVDITTLGNRAAGEADVRALSSTQTPVVLSTGTPATVEGTTLEQPPAQTQCGGLNSSLSVGTITLAQPLAPNASVNVQFLLGVVQGGSFRFLVNVEGLTNPPASQGTKLAPAHKGAGKN